MTYEKIKVLEQIEHVRLRPSLWIGNTEDPTPLFAEIFDNCLDEALTGVCTEIHIKYDERSFSVTDNGRGVPQNYNNEHKDYDPVLICTRLFSGGKFSSDSYDSAIGLHGVGLSATNFLSDAMELITWRNGQKFSVCFEDGVPQEPEIIKIDDKSSGTCVEVIPSPRFFRSTGIRETYVFDRVRIALMFIPSLNITINDKKVDRTDPASEVEGDLSPIEVIAFAKHPETEKQESVKIYLNYSLTKTESKMSKGVVNLREVNTGAHIRVFQRALIASWRAVLSSADNDYLEDNDFLLGCRGYIALRLTNPKYSSQTKEALAGTIYEFAYIQTAITDKLTAALNKNITKKDVQALIHRFKDYRANLNAISSSKYMDELLSYGEKDKHGITRGVSLESKLIDCISKNRENTELFVVEGDSAKSGLKKTRNPQRHAILPLRGKLRNIVDEDISKVLNNIEIRSLINAIGIGIKQKQDISRIRYDKIIIATDPDVDGGHIQVLIIGALSYLVPDVIKHGYLYIAETPLLGQYNKKKFIPIYDEKNLSPGSKHKRYKGLGSFNADEIGEILINETSRRLHQVVSPTDENINIARKLVGDPKFRKSLLVKNGVIEESY